MIRVSFVFSLMSLVYHKYIPGIKIYQINMSFALSNTCILAKNVYRYKNKEPGIGNLESGTCCTPNKLLPGKPINQFFTTINSSIYVTYKYFFW